MKCQQGDVILRRISDVPPHAIPRLDNHLAEGEMTGHFHAAVGDGVAVLQHKGGLVLDAPTGARIVHQEHKEIVVPPGVYEVRRVREYDHFAEEARQVRD